MPERLRVIALMSQTRCVTVIEMLESEPPYFDDECMEVGFLSRRPALTSDDTRYAVRCAVLTSRIVLRMCCAMSGTDIAYHPTRRCRKL
eukprot:2949172-Rhodomonas_salina.1